MQAKDEIPTQGGAMNPAPPKNELSLFENFSKHRSSRGDEAQISRFSDPIREISQSLLTSAATFQTGFKKVALLLFSVAVLLAGGVAAVRGQSALDGFYPNPNNLVFAVVVQADGKILLGGGF